MKPLWRRGGRAPTYDRLVIYKDFEFKRKNKEINYPKRSTNIRLHMGIPNSYHLKTSAGFYRIRGKRGAKLKHESGLETKILTTAAVPMANVT